jgi:hypothetical protein
MLNAHLKIATLSSLSQYPRRVTAAPNTPYRFLRLISPAWSVPETIEIHVRSTPAVVDPPKSRPHDDRAE